TPRLPSSSLLLYTPLFRSRHLESHAKVAWVNYPGLESSPYHALAAKYMPSGTCGVISFGVKGGREAASRFMAGLKLCSIATHVRSEEHTSELQSRFDLVCR